MKRSHKLVLLAGLLTVGMATALAAGPRGGGQGFNGGGGGRCLQTQTVGAQMLSAQERLALREEMRGAKTQAERNAIRAEHRQLVQERLQSQTPRK